MDYYEDVIAVLTTEVMSLAVRNAVLRHGLKKRKQEIPDGDLRKIAHDVFVDHARLRMAGFDEEELAEIAEVEAHRLLTELFDDADTTHSLAPFEERREQRVELRRRLLRLLTEQEGASR